MHPSAGPAINSIFLVSATSLLQSCGSDHDTFPITTNLYSSSLSEPDMNAFREFADFEVGGWNLLFLTACGLLLLCTFFCVLCYFCGQHLRHQKRWRERTAASSAPISMDIREHEGYDGGEVRMALNHSVHDLAAYPSAAEVPEHEESRPPLHRRRVVEADGRSVVHLHPHPHSERRPERHPEHHVLDSNRRRSHRTEHSYGHHRDGSPYGERMEIGHDEISPLQRSQSSDRGRSARLSSEEVAMRSPRPAVYGQNGRPPPSYYRNGPGSHRGDRNERGQGQRARYRDGSEMEDGMEHSRRSPDGNGSEQVRWDRTAETELAPSRRPWPRARCNVVKGSGRRLDGDRWRLRRRGDDGNGWRQRERALAAKHTMTMDEAVNIEEEPPSTTPRTEALSEDPDDDESGSTTVSSDESTTADSDGESASEGDSEEWSTEEAESEDTAEIEDGDEADTTTNDYVQNFGRNRRPNPNPFSKRCRTGYVGRSAARRSPRERMRAKLSKLSPSSLRRQPVAAVSYHSDDDVIGILKHGKVLESGRPSDVEAEMALEAASNSEEEAFEDVDGLSSLKAIKRRQRRFRHVADHSNTADSDHRDDSNPL